MNELEVEEAFILPGLPSRNHTGVQELSIQEPGWRERRVYGEEQGMESKAGRVVQDGLV